MITYHNKDNIQWYQLDINGVCYIGFEFSVLLNQLPIDLKEKVLTFLN